jgi:tRNA-specific 2-thiouridylase
MSGGVDSAVAAALTVESGSSCVGLTLRLGLERWGAERDAETISRAAAICARLGIEHRTFDAAELFAERVVRPYAEAYARGETPNPCVACNEHVKFGALLEESKALGADSLVTGHYARVGRERGGVAFLRRARDLRKDQTYFLYRVSSTALDRCSFPLGELTKDEVRRAARERGLSDLVRAESREACFAADGDRTALVASLAPEALEPGEIVEADGCVVGTHEGVARYTVGQRHGLGGGASEPRYVVRIDADERRVFVGTPAELRVSRVEAEEVVWSWSEPDVEGEVLLRYRGRGYRARCGRRAETLVAELVEPARAPAPGQALVCYKGDRVCGGGRIRVAS